MKKFPLATLALIAAPLSAQQATPPALTDVTTGAGIITTAPSAASTAAPAAANDVAAIIAREFPAYDKDADGGLSSAEFTDWMLRLKTIADPALQRDAPATKTWLNAAFAQADADKSRAVTLPELTGFLTAA